MLFCTANSLNNPFQKDCALNAGYIGNASKPAPFGDYLSFDKETPYAQPIVTSVTASPPSTCPGNYGLTAKIQDTLFVNASGSVEPSIQLVEFYYWYDLNGDGTTAGDAGSAWTYAAPGALQPGSLNTWTASWDANSLPRGRYLIGVQALDDRTKHDLGVPDAPIDHRTFSYLPGSTDPATQAQIYTNDWSWDGLAKIWVQGTEIGWIDGQEALFPAHADPPVPGPSEDWYGNPDVTGVQTALIGVALNVCGVAPELLKSANVVETTAGGDVQYTLSVVNQTGADIKLSSITDTLPEGFTYVSTQGPGDTPASSLCTGSCPEPSTAGGNSYTWTFAANPSDPAAVTIPGGCSAPNYAACTRNLVYNTKASATVGTYNNTATMVTDFGTVASNPAQVGVGAPRLTISKTPTDGASPPNPKYSALPSESITYVITYSNDSPVTATNVVLTDVVPAGLDYVSCSDGCTWDGNTLTWTIGDLLPGEGPYSVSFTATIADPYPETAPAPNVNTATIDADNTDPADATASVFVQVPRPQLVIQKTADKLLVDPAGTSPANQVTYTLSYRNAGDATATNAVLTDVVPAGFSFVSATGGGSHDSGTVTWNLSDLAAGATGSVTVTLQVSDPYSGIANPAINTATLDADNAAPVVDDANVGIRQSGQVCSTYYFRDDTASVGFDGPQKLATTSPVPVVGDTGGSTLLTAPTGSSGQWSAPLSFYQDPASGSVVNLSGDLVTRMFIDRVNGPGIIVRTTVYDYNSVTGARSQIGQGETSFGGSQKGLLTLTVPFGAGAVLAKDHRLLWTYEVRSSVNNQSADILFQYNGTVVNTLSGGTTSTFADSDAEYCSAAPANLALDKQVDQSSVDATGASRTLTYTLNYANTSGSTGATGAILTDTLPLSGVTYSSCSVSGSSHFTGCSHTNGVISFHNGSNGGVSIPAGASGSVTVTVNVADSLSVSSLVNTASIISDQTSAVEATAITTVVGGEDPDGTANLIINKSASATLLQPGGAVTYILTALNAGTKTATAIQITDNFPNEDWLTFESGSCTASVGTCTPSGTPPDSLTWAIDSLAPGETATLSFRLKVGDSNTTSPPDGVTTRDNLATGAYEGCETAPCEATSNTVTVSVTTNPYLAIEKSVSPSGIVAPGETLTYTLLVSNSGSGAANNLIVRDPTPANTSFIAGSTTQTLGSASFDAVNNQVIFNLGTLAAGGSATLSFQVKLNSPLPAGDSTLTNLATVTASNAPSRTDDAVTTAQAVPVLTLDKSGPASAPYPAASLTAAANDSTTLFVNNTATFEIGQIIQVGATLTRITGIAGSTVTVDTAVTAAANADVIGAVTYSLTFRNTGNAGATGVVITDTLPAGPPGLTYVASSPNASSAPTIGASGDVVWTLGTLAAGASGAVQIIALPTGAGTVTNLATIDSAQTAPVEDSIQTAFGGLRITKRTTTPITKAPGEATYVIEVTNSLDSPVAGVTLTDSLASGFAYKSTVSATGATRTSTLEPTVGDQQPTWGTWTLPANGSLTLTFTATVTDSVGPGTYQNEAAVTTTTPGVGITPFDPLSTTAEDVTVLPPDTGLVEGIIYQDNDKDGQFDPAVDTPLGGVAVTIIASDGTVFVAMTDSSGFYSQVVPAGDTVIDVQNGTVPSDLILTTSTGDDGTDPVTVMVPSRDTASKNTGYVPADKGLASITGNVWNDADDNQVVNGSEAGMIGVQVILRDTNGDVVATEYTDALGNYAFPNIPPGDYQVDVVPPQGYLVTTGNDPAPVTVAAGETGTANFGLLQGVILSGTVFNDIDGNGVQDSGELGLNPGGLNLVVVDASGQVLAVAPVENDGTWSVLVKPGSGYQAYYSLQNPTVGDTVTPLAQLPAGWLVTGENISDTVQSPANGILTGINASVDQSGLNFGIRSGGSIGDYVWYDTNQDGIQDPAERGLAGVQVILYAADGTTQLAETRSDGSGKYEFAGLADGTYVVQFVTPADYLRSPVNAGTGSLQDSFDSDANDAAQGKVSVTITGGTANPTVDAGFYIEGVSPASIADFVWYDTDGDGIQDEGEPGLGGVTVSLLDADNGNALVATRISDATGFYEFAGLPAGNYVLQFTAPTGYLLSPQDRGGDDTKDSDAAPGTGLTATIALAAGQRLTDVDAGLYLQSGNPSSISDRVWYDTDGDGIQDTGEPGIPGVRVNLYDATGTALLQTTVTDPEGAYRFSGLPEGDYVVKVVKPNGSYVFSDAEQGGDSTKDSDPDPMTGRVTVTLTDGQDNTDIDAGLRVVGQSPISIGDFIWKDLDGQKDPDSGEGLANVEVVLYDSLGYPLARLKTDGTDANYGFTGVAAGGSYRVAIDADTLGNLIQIADPDAALDNRTDLINQTASTTAADFGYLATNPSVTVVKTAADDTDTQQIRGGGTASFKVSVTNTGNLTLTSILVTDPLTPACNFEIASLAPGASSTVKTCTKDNVTADFTNIAEVEAQPVDVSGKPVGDKITAQDGTEVDVINPAITITKTPDTQTVSSGGTASFSIKVKNTGDVTLSNVSVSDPLTSACAKTSADIPELGSMAPDAEVTYDCQSSILSTSFVNIASVTATPPVGAAVTASDSASVTVATPGISISKTPDVQTIHKGGTAEFTITVTNTGSVPLTDVIVTDPNSLDCAKTTGSLGITDADKTLSYTCSQTGVDASFDNTATVTAKADAADLTADAVAKVNVIDPGLKLTKLTNDANDDDVEITARTGTLVTWEYIVENTGDVPLTNVTVEDEPEVAITCPLSSPITLAVGASMTCLGYGAAGEGDYTNEATATGTSPIGLPVTAEDDSSYTGYNPGVIGNRIWLDENGNGILDAGEAGIANLKVELKDDTDTTVATAYTDTNGGYLFTDVTPGDYKIVVTPAPGLNPTYDEDSGVTSPDNETPVTLAAGVQHITADFGYNWVPPADSTNPSGTSTGAIGDRVWNDTNGDGVQNPGESGIEGVTLTLTAPGADGIFGTGDDTTATTTTDAAGNYIFYGLPSGAYSITVDTSTLPTGTGLTWTQTGDPDGAGSTDGKTTTPILLAPGDVYVNADFGYRPNQGSSIGDLIWFDMNANGQLDAGETGVPGIGIALVKDTDGNGVWDAGEPIIATTLTDASGKYLFPGLPEGDYVVVVTDAESLLYWALPSNDPDLPGQINNGLAPDPRFDQQAAVSVDGTSDQLAMDFGYMAYGMHNYSDIPGLIGSAGLIGDLVFLDRNGNEEADPGEGLQGVRVELYAPGDLLNPVAWTTTNAEGAYAFGHVNVFADWIIKIDRSTLPNAGVGLNNSLDPDGGMDDQSSVSNISETDNLNLDQDFGYTADFPSTVGGTLWQDLNANGILDASEASRLANITLELRDAAGNKVAATQTDSQGNYSFTGLPAGEYSVHVTDTRNLLEGWWHSLGDQNQTTDNTSKADPFTLTVTAGSSNTNIDFGYYNRGAALGNRVWNDVNGNGIQDSGETGLAGVTLQLVVTYPGGGSTTLKTLSGSDGGYSFGNLLLDESFNGASANEPTYEITAVAPAGYTASPIEEGTDRQVDSNDPAGTTATVLKGQLNTAVSANPATEPTNASYDFGFEPQIDLSLTKSVAPTSQKVNELVTFTLTLSNAAGFSNASGVKVTDLLQSGYSFVSATPSVGGYASDTGVWTVGNLAASTSATLTISARVNASGSYVNDAEVTAADQTDLDSTPANGAQDPEEDDRASVTPTIDPQIDLSLTKSISPTTPKVGETVTFTLTLNNAAGYSTATGVSVQDVVPAGYGAISEISDGGSAVGNTVTWTGLTVNANSNKSLTFKAKVLPGGSYENTAEIKAADQDDTDSTPDNSGTAPDEDDTDSVTPVPTAQIDLSLTKSVSPVRPKVGETVTFTLTLSNAAGYSDATGVRVQDQLPAGYGDVSAISDSGTLAGSTLTWSNLSVASGSSKELTFKAVVKNAGSYTNQAEVMAADQPDLDSTPGNGATPEPEDDRATLTPTVDPQIDLSLTKTVSPDSARVGDTVTFTLTLSNAAGFSNASGVAVTDQLPNGYRYVSATPSVGSYASSTGVWTVGDLAGGSSATLEIEARVMASGEYENVAEVTAADQDDKDSTPGNGATEPVEDDYASAKPTVTASADLIVEKNGPVMVDASGTITYTVTVSNAGPSPANDAVFADANPSGLTDMTWTCGNAVGGAVCPNPNGSGAINAIIASFPAGGSLTYSITGTAPTTGTVTNLATVTAPVDVIDPDPSNNSDQVETGLGATPATADLSVLKFGPAQVEAGGTLTYRLLVSNAGYAAANDAVFTDTVPVGVTNVSWTCEAVGGAVCPDDVTREGNGIEETIATFPAGASLIYRVTGTVTGSIGATIENTASIDAPDGVTDPDESNNESSVETIVVGPDDLTESADLALVKTGPATVAGGGTVTYKLVVSNAGIDAADGASVTDLVPSVLSEVTWTCGNATGGAVCPTLDTNLAAGALNSGKGDVNLTIPTFPAGASLTITVTGTAPAAGAFVNGAQVIPPDGVLDPDPSNNPGGPVITQIATVTLAGVVFNDNGVGDGEATNGLQDGSEPGVDPGSLNVVVLDDAGKVLAVVAVDDATGAWSAVVPAGNGYSVYVTTASPALGVTIDTPQALLPSGWTITGETADGSASDGTADGILIDVSATTSIDTLDFGIRELVSSLTITKTQTSGPNPVTAADQVLGYTILLENTGEVTLTGVVVTDTLPDSTVGSLTGPTESGTQNSQLDVGETWTYTVSYTVTQADLDAGVDLVNTAGVVTTQVPERQENTETTPVTQTPELSLNKELIDPPDPDPILVGSILSYRITATNTGNITLANVVVSDDLITPNEEVCDSLAPEAACVLEGTYEVTPADALAGKVVNTATADSTRTDPIDDTLETIVPIPDAPEAVNDQSLGNPIGSVVTLPVLENDSASDGLDLDATTVQIVDADASSDGRTKTVTGEGVWRVNETTGAITFTPDEALVGDPTTIRYSVKDNAGQISNEATVTITYTVAPVANDDDDLGNVPGTAVTLDVPDNDTVADGRTLDRTSVAIEGADAGSNGLTKTVAGEGVWMVDATTGAITFTPDSGVVLDPTPITYTIQDDQGNLSNLATVTVDYVPVAVDDESLGNLIGAPVTLDVTANDTDGDTVDPTTVQLVAADAGSDGLTKTVAGEGVWTVDPTTGAITFTPEAGFTGDPTPISYTVEDAEGNLSDPATVTVTYVITASIVRRCLDNTPYVDYKIESAAVGRLTIQWYDVLPDGERGSANGDPLRNQQRVGRLLWPGAVVNAAGDVVTWPGWELIDGQWVRTNPRAQEIKDIVFSINPTISVRVQYPEPEPSCRPYPPIPVANDDVSLGNPLGNPVTVSVLTNDVPLAERPFVPATVQILGTAEPGDPLVVEGEGTWSVLVVGDSVEITFTPLLGFPGNPTPIQYLVTDTQEATSNPATVTITYEGGADLTLLKEVADAPSKIGVGSRITYRITATNTGSRKLTGVMISDDLPGLSKLNCKQPATLRRGASLSCTATYIVRRGDVSDGGIDNTAVVEATTRSTTGGDWVLSRESSVTLPIIRQPIPEPVPALAAVGLLFLIGALSLLGAAGARRRMR